MQLFSGLSATVGEVIQALALNAECSGISLRRPKSSVDCGKLGKALADPNLNARLADLGGRYSQARPLTTASSPTRLRSGPG